MKRIYTDRSRTIEAQRCKRRRWYGYHEGTLGISSARTPLPLAVGGSVHAGLAQLLRYAAEVESSGHTPQWDLVEEGAVEIALADFAQYTGALELDTTEVAAMTTVAGVPEELDALLAKSLGMAANDPAIAMLKQSADRAGREFDQYLAAEQAALVEAMVRAYSRRRLRPLLEQFEVLEVEREGQWLLSSWGTEFVPGTRQEFRGAGAIYNANELWFMSRPDALLRERSSNQLYLQSFKTAASWDVRKARDAEHDMQGLSEGVEVERRLAKWWDVLRPQAEGRFPQHTDDLHINGQHCSRRMQEFLQSCPAPPRILGVRYEFLLKGERWKDKDLTSRLQFEARSQRSHLVRGYLNQGMASGDEQWNFSWEYIKEGGEPSKLYYKTWKSAPVWEHMPIKAWIDMLDATVMAQAGAADASGQDVRELGYTSPAQATGFTATHPLDDVFIPPLVVYRNDDDLRDLVESMEYQERVIAEQVVEVEGTTNEGERRHLLNQYFPMSRHACEYPSTCPYVKLCYGGEDIRRDALASGLYKVRSANHPQEMEASHVSE